METSSKLAHHCYQPSNAELEEEFHTDATFDEIVSACMQPVKITYDKPSKANRE